jgi:hypothetical protein
MHYLQKQHNCYRHKCTLLGQLPIQTTPSSVIPNFKASVETLKFLSIVTAPTLSPSQSWFAITDTIFSIYSIEVIFNYKLIKVENKLNLYKTCSVLMTNTRTFCEWIGYKDNKTAKHDNQFCKEVIESKIEINKFAIVLLTSLKLAIF